MISRFASPLIGRTPANIGKEVNTGVCGSVLPPAAVHGFDGLLANVYNIAETPPAWAGSVTGSRRGPDDGREERSRFDVSTKENLHNPIG